MRMLEQNVMECHTDVYHDGSGLFYLFMDFTAIWFSVR